MSKNRNRKQRSQNEMKQTPPKDSSKTQVNNVVCVSSESNENTSVEDKSISAKDGIIKPIVDRFDFQLLITIIIFFVSAWVYLNGVICNFTESDPISFQISHIFVHYVLTVVLIFSVVLSAIKSVFLINNGIQEKNNKWFNLFLNSWFWILLISLLTILFSKAFPFVWLFFALVTLLFILFRMKDLQFSYKSIISSVFVLIIGFPLFLSIMTSTIVNVEANTDKPFYSFSDKVLITVNARGYACKHKLVGLSEEYKDAKYYYEKGLIMLNAFQIKNNEIAIGTISPAKGFPNFFIYSIYKITGSEPTYNDDKENIHYTPISIYVKP